MPRCVIRIILIRILDIPAFQIFIIFPSRSFSLVFSGQKFLRKTSCAPIVILVTSAEMIIPQAVRVLYYVFESSAPAKYISSSKSFSGPRQWCLYYTRPHKTVPCNARMCDKFPPKIYECVTRKHTRILSS